MDCEISAKKSYLIALFLNICALNKQIKRTNKFGSRKNDGWQRKHWKKRMTFVFLFQLNVLKVKAK